VTRVVAIEPEPLAGKMQGSVPADAGHDLCEELRARRDTGPLPVVRPRSQTADKARAFAVGAADYLVALPWLLY
jgi:DNA-binding response OmpR family regulator